MGRQLLQLEPAPVAHPSQDAPQRLALGCGELAVAREILDLLVAAFDHLPLAGIVGMTGDQAGRLQQYFKFPAVTHGPLPYYQSWKVASNPYHTMNSLRITTA